MKLKTPLLALIGFMAATPVFSAEQTVTFSVPGMYCASCPFIVDAAMSDVEGVISVTADSDTRTALVVFEDTLVSAETIAAASTNVGYEALIVEAES